MEIRAHVPRRASKRVRILQSLVLAILTVSGCDTTDPVDPVEGLGAPRIAGPICDIDASVRVTGSVAGATVTLMRNGEVAGQGESVGGELQLSLAQPLKPGDQLAVRQQLGERGSSESARITVCACSDSWLAGRISEILDSAAPESQPVGCASSSVPLFQNTDPFDVLEVTLRANFDVINGEPIKDDAWSPGTLTYEDPMSGGTVSIDCTIEARGSSRFRACAWRPLKLRFPSDPIGTLFEGTGKKIKTVTHCGFKATGDPRDEWLSGGTVAEQTRRVMQEFTQYEVLGATGSTALETRLAHFTYQDTLGTVLETQIGFFREREERAAERCGFARLEEDEGDPLNTLPPNIVSDMQARFHSFFLFSHDFDPQQEHNVVRMGGTDGMEYYIPYDFDLTGVIRPDYEKNKGWSIEKNGEELIAWLSSLPNQGLARVQVASLLQHEAEMRQRVVDVPVDAAGAARLSAWFEDHVRRLKCYLN